MNKAIGVLASSIAAHALALLALPNFAQLMMTVKIQASDTVVPLAINIAGSYTIFSFHYDI